MPSFAYQAINEVGVTVSGTMEADSADSARTILSNQGYIPTKVVETGVTAKSSFLSAMKHRLGSVSTPDLIIFTKQFHTLLSAGVPIVRLLQVLVAEPLASHGSFAAFESAVNEKEKTFRSNWTVFGAMNPSNHFTPPIRI